MLINLTCRAQQNNNLLEIVAEYLLCVLTIIVNE